MRSRCRRQGAAQVSGSISGLSVFTYGRACYIMTRPATRPQNPVTQPAATAMPQRPPVRRPGRRARRPQVRFRMLRTIVALMLREIATTYGRSAGGYLWTVAEPIAAIALLAFLFSMTFERPAIGDNFALFYATGYLPFMLYNDVAAKVSHAIPFSRPLLAYPSVTYVDALIARLALAVLTEVVIFFVILVGIDLIFDLDIIWNLTSLLQAILLTSLLGAGVGALNGYLFLEFPGWERAWAIANRPLFLISGTLFTYHMMPPPAKAVLWWNPLIHCVGLVRDGVYSTYDASYVAPILPITVGLLTLCFGLLLLSRHYQRLIER